QETAPSPSTRPLRAADYPGAPAHLPQGSDIPSLPPAHAASAGISLGEALGEPVRVAGARAPLWALLLGPAAALLLLGGGCGALLFGGSPAPAQLQPAAVEPAGSAAQASSGATASAAASPAEAPAPSAE